MSTPPGKLCFLTALAAILFLAAAARAGDGLVAGIDGLPLMPELALNAGEVMIFDAPSGRIVEASASGLASVQQAIDFYAQALPELGWTRNSELVYSREDEVLKLELSAKGPVLNVRFALSPARSGLR